MHGSGTFPLPPGKRNIRNKRNSPAQSRWNLFHFPILFRNKRNSPAQSRWNLFRMFRMGIPKWNTKHPP
jgi:hypothetical protein